MRRAILRALVCLALAAPFATRAHAQLKLNFDIAGHSDDTDSYLWARLTVSNPTANPLDFRIDITNPFGGGQCSVNDQKIEPGADRVYNIPLPMFRGAQVSVVDSAGNKASDYKNAEVRRFLNICDVGGWASQKTMQDYSAKTGIAPDPGRYYGGGLRGGTAPSVNYFTQLEPADLPTDWRCYAALSQVFVRDDAWRRMDAAAKQALMNWLRLGGTLSIYGGDRDGTEEDMQGEIFYSRDNPIESLTLRSNPHNKPVWERFVRQSATQLADFPFHVVETGGTTGGLALATLFCILAGPVNLWHWRRKNRIRMVLVTVPVLSIIFCLLITGYFVVSQGFQRRGGTISLTILDEASNSAFTHGFHSLNSGLYPMGGFRFAPGVGFYPLTGPNQDEGFRMDLSSGTRLISGLFKPTINFDYFTLQPHQTREKMVFDFDKLTATNGFETPIKKIAVTRGGRTWLAGPLAPGERVALKEKSAVEGSAGPALFSTTLGVFDDGDIAAFLNANAVQNASWLRDNDKTYYLAELGGKAPEAAYAGVTINKGRQLHALLGIAAAPGANP